MKALELADAYADACFDQALNARTEDPIPEQKRDELAAELRRLAAVESDCAPYLKEGETPAERIKRALGDADSLMNLYRDVMAERDALKAKFGHTLAECRDAYPVPEVGSELEALWGQAMGDPASVGAYVKACATSQKKEIDALKAENERLTNCLKKANDQAEDFERRWYLADMELERIKALEPIGFVSQANMKFLSESAAKDWIPIWNTPTQDPWDAPTKASKIPLYALGSKTDE